MPGVSGAWFDTVAFEVDADERRLLICDLDRLKYLGNVALDGRPGAGIVGPAGVKLFFPTTNDNAVDVRRAKLRMEFRQLAKGSGKTVLHIIHSIDQAIAPSDRVVVFGSPGRVVADLRQGHDISRRAGPRALAQRRNSSPIPGVA